MSDKENAVQQAQIWAQEARTQRDTVLAILRFFGLPERDYEALTLIQAKDSEDRAAMLLALDALEQVTTSETFFRDPRGDRAGPAIDALRAVLTSGVPVVETPAGHTSIPTEPTHEIYAQYLGRALLNMDKPHYERWERIYREVVATLGVAGAPESKEQP